MTEILSIVLALGGGLISPSLILGAVIILAILLALVSFYLFRGGKKKGAKGAPTPGASGWQGQSPPQEQQPGGWGQQPQPGQQPGGWGQQPQPGQQPGGWGQQPQPGQQPGGWGQQPQDPQQAAWGQQQPGGWGQQPQPGQQPGGWGQQPQPGQQPGGWGQPQDPQQAAWGQQPQPGQQPGGWGQQPQDPQAAWGQPAPAQPDPWGQQQAAPQGWGGQPAPVQNAYPAAGSNPAWGQPAQPAPAQPDPWGQQPQYQGVQGSGPQNWSQPNNQWGGQQDATVFGGPEGDKTMLRPSGPQTGMGMVRVEEGKEPGRVYQISKESLSIGRSRESDIFLEDLAVSRLHATILNLGNGNYALKDEGSANGTKVNGQLVNKYQTYPLQEGDHIQLGQTVLAFARK